jgi:mannose-6-phosphate isomerase
MRRNQKAAPKLYPLRFRPAYKDYPWGGSRILQKYRRREPPGIYAESWEISDHPDGVATVANGPFKGVRFDQVMASFGPSILGPRVAPAPFPLLVKILDARETLSVQVHPDDRAARRWGGEPKTETWYFLDAPAGSGVYAGWEPRVTRAKVERALKNGSMEKLLRFVPVLPGDTVFMPGGRVHAIGAGCFILEVQRRANTTYRLYDWNRRDPHGRLRPLHTQQALRCIHWRDTDPVKLSPRKLPCADPNIVRDLLAATPFFRIERLRMKTGATFRRPRLATCDILFTAQGAVRLKAQKHMDLLTPGTTCLVPHELRAYTLITHRAPAEVLIITPTGR